MLGLEPLPRSFEAALRDARHEKAKVRLSAVRDLGQHARAPDGDRAVAVLISALAGDVSAEVRGAAALALADAEARGAIDALLSAAEDASVRVRQMALIALGELGEKADGRVARVVAAALTDGAPALRFQGLIAASRLELPLVEAALVAATKDPDEEVRYVSFRLLEERATTEGLTVRPSDEALDAARQRLGDPALAVRLAAAILLGRAGDHAGAQVLAEAVDAVNAALDPEDEQAAIVLAGELALRETMPGLERRAFRAFGLGTAFAYEARIALARMGDLRARAAIVRGLSAFTRDTRTLAVVAAGRAKLEEARPLLISMRAAEKRADPGAVEEALLALGDTRSD